MTQIKKKFLICVICVYLRPSNSELAAKRCSKEINNPLIVTFGLRHRSIDNVVTRRAQIEFAVDLVV